MKLRYLKIDCFNKKIHVSELIVLNTQDNFSQVAINAEISIFKKNVKFALLKCKLE